MMCREKIQSKAGVQQMDVRGRDSKRCLQRRHVIEGMVQFFTNGLVLQLLSIQLIWMSEVDSKDRRVSRQQRHKQAKSRMREMEADRSKGKEGEDKKKIRSDF